MNTTTNSFSSFREKSSDNNINLNFNKTKNNKKIHQNTTNNSLCDDSSYIFNKSVKFNKIHNNTFIDMNKTCFINKKNINKVYNNQNMSTHLHNNKPNNLFNKNAELELLLIQIKKILFKN
jgi:hypothetical protein